MPNSEMCVNCISHDKNGLCTKFESELYGDYTSDDNYCVEFESIELKDKSYNGFPQNG